MWRYSKECNWYTRCCLLNGGVCYRECPLREAILCMLYIFCHQCIYSMLYMYIYIHTCICTYAYMYMYI